MRPTVAIDPSLVSSIRNRQETVTIRRGHRTYPLGPASFKAADVEIQIDILRLEYKTVKDLTDQDAINDGERTLDSLKSALRGFYPTLSDSDEVTLVYFALKD
jgi:hypothetical protein